MMAILVSKRTSNGAWPEGTEGHPHPSMQNLNIAHHQGRANNVAVNRSHVISEVSKAGKVRPDRMRRGRHDTAHLNVNCPKTLPRCHT